MSRIIRPEEVVHKVGLCDRLLRDMERDGQFPKRFKLNGQTGRAVGWFEDEIDAWIEKRREEVRG